MIGLYIYSAIITIILLFVLGVEKTDQNKLDYYMRKVCFLETYILKKEHPELFENLDKQQEQEEKEYNYKLNDEWKNK